MSSSDGNSASGGRPDLTKYLFEEEANFVTGDFREYFLTKRFNLIATVNAFSDISELYFRTDQNWVEAMRGLAFVTDGNRVVPTQLTIFCFREIRMAAELLLSCCTTLGFSHLRSAIESFVHAQRILREPTLSRVWCMREEEPEEYNEHFKANFKANMFPESSGFAPLHSVWKMLCDAGPHPNSTSVGLSSSISDLGTNVQWQLEFFTVDLREISNNLLMMIKCELEMFKCTYAAFHEQLSLQPHLLQGMYSHLAECAKLMRKYASNDPT